MYNHNHIMCNHKLFNRWKSNYPFLSAKLLLGVTILTARSYKQLQLTGYGAGRRGSTWKGGQAQFNDR